MSSLRWLPHPTHKRFQISKGALDISHNISPTSAAQQRHDIVREDLIQICNTESSTLRHLDGKHVVITGASGLLARYLVETISWWNEHHAEKPCRLSAIVRTEPSENSEYSYLLNTKDVQFITHDARTAVHPLDNVDYYVLAATKGSPKYYLQDPTQTLSLNGGGLEAWLTHAKNSQPEKVLYISSGEVYGTPGPDHIPTPETYHCTLNPTDPRAIYAGSKIFGELQSLSFQRQYGVPVTIARPFQVFGPGIRANDGRAMGDFLFAASRGEDIALQSAGNALRTFMYIADATRAFLKQLVHAQPGSIYNVGCEEPEISILDLAHRIASQAASELQVTVANPDKGTLGSPVRSCPDTRKIHDDLGFSPQHSVDDLISRTLSWLESQTVKTQQ